MTPQTHPHPRPASTDMADDATVERLIAEAENGIAEQKLRRRPGRPPLSAEAASTYSVRLPDDLVTLVDTRAELEGISRGETIRKALVEYLTT